MIENIVAFIKPWEKYSLILDRKPLDRLWTSKNLTKRFPSLERVIYILLRGKDGVKKGLSPSPYAPGHDMSSWEEATRGNRVAGKPNLLVLPRNKYCLFTIDTTTHRYD